MQMTAEEYNQRLTELGGLVSGDLASVLLEPAQQMLVSIKRRITRDGKNSSNADIGQYSQEPIYTQKEQFVKKGAFKAQGKYANKGNRIVPTVLVGKAKHLKLGNKFLPLLEGKNKYTRFSILKNTYQERKTMYLEHGYKQLRDVQGMPTDNVKSKYRGDLINDYQLQKEAQSILLGFTDQKQSDKRKWMEKHFNGAIYAPNQEEIKNYSEVVNFIIRRLTQNVIEGVNVAATIE